MKPVNKFQNFKRAKRNEHLGSYKERTIHKGNIETYTSRRTCILAHNRKLRTGKNCLLRIFTAVETFSQNNTVLHIKLRRNTRKLAAFVDPQYVDESTRCANIYKWSLFFTVWLYMFRTITCPSSVAPSSKLSHAFGTFVQASLAVTWLYEGLHLVHSCRRV